MGIAIECCNDGGGGGGGGTPGGVNTTVQFNDSGSFGGDAGLKYDKSTGTLKLQVVDDGEYAVELRDSLGNFQGGIFISDNSEPQYDGSISGGFGGFTTFQANHVTIADSLDLSGIHATPIVTGTSIEAPTFIVDNFITMKNNTSITPDLVDGHVATLGAYDVDGDTIRTFLTLTNANTPSMTISEPAGGALVYGAPSAMPSSAVVFNDAGSFGGDAGLTWDKTTKQEKINTPYTSDPSAGNPAGLRVGANLSNGAKVSLESDNNDHSFPEIVAFSSEGTMSAPEDSEDGDVLFSLQAHGLLTSFQSVTRLFSVVSGIGAGLGGQWLFQATDTSGVPHNSVSIQATGMALLDGAALQTDTTTAHTALLQAYDVDGTAYKTFLTLTNGNTPDLTIAPPSGGTVTLQASTFKSSDGSTGATGTATAANTLTIKNGLVTVIA